MKKFGAQALYVIVLYVIQSSLLPLLSWHEISADLLLVAVVSVSFLRGSREGAAFGFCAGLLQDLATGTFLGIHAFSQLLIGMFFGRFSDRVFKEQFFLPVFASVAAIVANYFILALLMVLLGYRFNLVSSLQTMLLPMLIYQL